MASKKRKVDFSADAILSEISQAREFTQNVQHFRKTLSLAKITEMLRTVHTVDFDVAGLLALLLGFDIVMWTMRAINHVPKAFDCYKKSRSGIIHQIVDFLCPQRGLTPEIMEEVVTFLEEFGSNWSLFVNDSEFERALLRLNGSGKVNFSRFIAPPVTDCLHCGSLLITPNPPSSGIVYTLRGPQPLTKLNLRCQDCKVSLLVPSNAA